MQLALVKCIHIQQSMQDACSTHYITVLINSTTIASTISVLVICNPMQQLMSTSVKSYVAVVAFFHESEFAVISQTLTCHTVLISQECHSSDEKKPTPMPDNYIGEALH